MPRKRKVDIVVKAKDEFSKTFDKLEDSLSDSQKATLGAVGAMAVGAAAAVGAITLITKAYNELVSQSAVMETATAEINTLLGLSEKEAHGLASELDSLATEFGQLNTVMAKAQYDVISAGFSDAADSMRILRTASKAAIAGVTDVGTSAKLLTQVLNAYGMEVSEVEKVSDILFTTVKEGVTTFPELATSLGQVMATASAAGIRFEELTAAIAAMTKGGINSQEAATALNGLLLAIAAASGESKTKLDELGITLEYGLGPALVQLAAVGEDGLSVLKELIPNIRGLKAAASAGRDGARVFTDSLKAMDDGMGNTNRAYRIMADTFEHQKDRVTAGWVELKNVIGREGLEGATDVLREVAGLLGDVAELAGPAAKQIGQLATALAAVTTENIDGLATALETIAELFGGKEEFTKFSKYILMLHAATPAGNLFIDTLHDIDIALERVSARAEKAEKNAKELTNLFMQGYSLNIIGPDLPINMILQQMKELEETETKVDVDSSEAEDKLVALIARVTEYGATIDRHKWVVLDAELVLLEKSQQELLAEIQAFLDKMPKYEIPVKVVLDSDLEGEFDLQELDESKIQQKIETAIQNSLPSSIVIGSTQIPVTLEPGIEQFLMDHEIDLSPTPESMTALDELVSKQERISRATDRVGAIAGRAFGRMAQGAANAGDVIKTVLLSALEQLIPLLIAGPLGGILGGIFGSFSMAGGGSLDVQGPQLNIMLPDSIDLVGPQLNIEMPASIDITAPPLNVLTPFEYGGTGTALGTKAGEETGGALFGVRVAMQEQMRTLQRIASDFAVAGAIAPPAFAGEGGDGLNVTVNALASGASNIELGSAISDALREHGRVYL